MLKFEVGDSGHDYFVDVGLRDTKPSLFHVLKSSFRIYFTLQKYKNRIFAAKFNTMKENLFTEDLQQSTGMRVFLYLIILLVFSLIGGVITFVMMYRDANLMKLAQGISSTLMFIVPPIVFYFITRKVRPMRAIGFKEVRSPWWFFITIAVVLMIVSIPVTNQLTLWNERMDLGSAFAKLEAFLKKLEDSAEALTEQMLNVDNFSGLLVNLLIIALIPAIGEELTFRGVLQQSLTKGLKNPHIAIILSAAIFSFIHFQFYGFLPRMFLGILLGYMFYISGSLWTSILMHFVNNGMAVVLYYLNNKGVIDVDVDHFGALPLGLTALSAVVTVGIIVWSWRKKEAQDLI